MRKQNQIVLARVATVGEWGEIQVYSPRAVFFFFFPMKHAGVMAFLNYYYLIYLSF